MFQATDYDKLQQIMEESSEKKGTPHQTFRISKDADQHHQP